MDEDNACNPCSCNVERCCRVLLLHVDDPRRGVGSGNSLMWAGLADSSVRAPSGVVWCVLSLFHISCCSSTDNGDNRLWLVTG